MLPLEPLRQMLFPGSSSGRNGAAGGGAMYPSSLDPSVEALLGETSAGGRSDGRLGLRFRKYSAPR